MHKIQKTNAMRQLDAAGIPYEAKEYEYDESDLSGLHIAKSIGLDRISYSKRLSHAAIKRRMSCSAFRAHTSLI